MINIPDSIPIRSVTGRRTDRLFPSAFSGGGVATLGRAAVARAAADGSALYSKASVRAAETSIVSKSEGVTRTAITTSTKRQRPLWAQSPTSHGKIFGSFDGQLF